MNKDKIYSNSLGQVAPFEFNEKVVQVFDDMLQRSVPLYHETLLRQAQMAAHYHTAGTRIYDLGCSHGNFGVTVQKMMQARPFELIGIDPSAPMLARYRQRLAQLSLPPTQKFTLLQQPAQAVAYAPCTVVVANLTLQFMPLEVREDLLRRLYAALEPGGVLLLSEKVEDADPCMADIEREWYYSFKRENGYSELEISQKRDALEDVLVPETCEVHQQRLRTCGFSQVSIWLKWFNFAGFLCIKR
ncbi:MAG: carboxy-S-adenosyl-L-methionine synthase CmoA [Desulfuromonadaceae bacterium]|nr:carboxy-S-adenosyl-L-methionine synthase CmoA [Desulfuromonadaceae bacterium]